MLATAMAGDAQLMAALRRQLEQLAYDAAALTPQTAPLVAALLSDLVKATDSCRALKVQAGDAGQSSQTLQYQVSLPAGPARQFLAISLPSMAAAAQPATPTSY